MKDVDTIWEHRWRLPALAVAGALCPLLFLAPVQGAPLASVPPVGEAVSAAADLAGDARLQRAVRVDEAGVSLEELLATFSTQDLTLSSTPSCKEQKLQIRLNDRPLRTLMEAVADLLPGQWKSVPGGGYLLEMDAEAVRRRDRWWRLFLGERERALAAQRARALHVMRETPPEIKPDEPRGAGSGAGGAEGVPFDWRGEMAAARAIYPQLPASLQERIASQMNDTIFYGAVLGSMGDLDEGATLIRLDQLPSSVQDVVQERIERMRLKDAPSWNGTMLRFKNDGLTVRTEVMFPSERLVPAFHLSVRVGPDAAALPLSQDWLMDRMRDLGRAAPLTWKQLAAYQNSHVWQNDPPDPARKPNQFPPPRRADVLDWLGEQGKIEFVADYYSTPSTLMKPSDLERPKLPLKEELNYRAFEQDMSWKQREDKVYLFRNNRWYRDDRLEVPAVLLKRWLADQETPAISPQTPTVTPAVSQPNGGGREPVLPPAEALRKQLDWEAEVITTLTPFQIASGLRWFVREEPATPATLATDAALKETGNLKERLRKATQEAQKDPVKWLGYRIQRAPFRFQADRLLPRRHALRFYAGLTSAARTSLIEGNLRVSTLSATQRAQAEYLLPQLTLLSESAGAARARLGLQFQSQPSIRQGETAFTLRLIVAPFASAEGATQR